MDERIKKLAENLVNYSCEVKEGEKVLIQVNGESAKPLVRQLVKEVYKAKAYPFVSMVDSSINRELIMEATKEQLEVQTDVEMYQMQKMDAYIGVRASDNITELADVPADKMGLHSKMTRPVTDQRVNHTKWVVLRYPNYSMAQLAGSSLESFEDFYFNVCNLDYNKMSVAMDPLVELMNKTDKVRITGPGTDLTFSIKDIPAIKCDGKMNIPDGEVYAAPVVDSVNGVLTYNTPSQYQGFTYDNVKFVFKDGKIVEATANNTEKINQVLDTDEGARYIGEFAIGVNPYILKPMNDILFDEKIMGSFHFTPGMCYEDAANGNESAVHWDLVCIQTEAYGGGEMYFDDVLIRKDGIFVHPDLVGLNPENLI
ncbi:aminopeptidase [Alkalibacter rhizosphaerae]|uniref:Aminopeptidase n=1 Tax=Alkalibacter rhizosphaerae TaxID=2815577 RepID=A0A975AJ38_9FIRM|nr:aminopeptidase [Alkalibacter rhizosphaerae]QSX09324.1 aminopeptidase [Alkalibacter rhizosphaerae]